MESPGFPIRKPKSQSGRPHGPISDLGLGFQMQDSAFSKFLCLAIWDTSIMLLRTHVSRAPGAGDCHPVLIRPVIAVRSCLQYGPTAKKLQVRVLGLGLEFQTLLKK